MTLVWAFLYLLVAVAGHGLLMRRRMPGNSVMRFLAIGGGIGSILAVQMFLCHRIAIPALTALAVYALGCEMYLFLFTLVGSSIGASLLLTLRGGALPAERIESMFSPAGMVDCRLERLRKVGLLEANGRVSPKGRRLLHTFRMLRAFFLPNIPMSKARMPAPIAELELCSWTLSAEKCNNT